MLKQKTNREEKTLFFRAVREERRAVQLGKTKKGDRKSAKQALMREVEVYSA